MDKRTKLVRMNRIVCILLLFISSSFVCADSNAYIAAEDVQSRVVRLETKIQLKFEELEKALVLARELGERDRTLAFSTMNTRLESMNEFRAQINKAEATYATKDSVDARVKELERLVYIGVGLVLALQFLMVIYVRNNGIRNKPEI